MVSNLVRTYLFSVSIQKFMSSDIYFSTSIGPRWWGWLIDEFGYLSVRSKSDVNQLTSSQVSGRRQCLLSGRLTHYFLIECVWSLLWVIFVYHNCMLQGISTSLIASSYHWNFACAVRRITTIRPSWLILWFSTPVRVIFVENDTGGMWQRLTAMILLKRLKLGILFWSGPKRGVFTLVMCPNIYLIGVTGNFNRAVIGSRLNESGKNHVLVFVLCVLSSFSIKPSVLPILPTQTISRDSIWINLHLPTPTHPSKSASVLPLRAWIVAFENSRWLDLFRIV